MNSHLFFQYGEKELTWLKSRDPVLKKFIRKTGIIKRRIHPDPFYGLIHAVIGQQLSNKAKTAILKRFLEQYPRPSPEILSACSVDKLKTCGLSASKAACILNISRMFTDGDLDGGEMAALDDESLAQKLSAIKGVGSWTVEMLLIFTFQRKNILSFGDLALKKGLGRLYGYDGVTREVFQAHYDQYSPFATIASFYLWEAAAQ